VDDSQGSVALIKAEEEKEEVVVVGVVVAQVTQAKPADLKC
jgi:hypothetical protein